MPHRGAFAPVVIINGARQTGKSTLAQGLFAPEERPQYVSLDDIATLSLAKSSPKSLIQSFKGPVIIDEIQRAPELFLPIKEAVDKSSRPGNYILTGSSNVLALPKLADSLAGRMEIHTLWPLSQGEFQSKTENFIDQMFDSQPVPPITALELPELLDILSMGGYPGVRMRPTRRTQENWYNNYLNSLLERDVRELQNIEGLTELPNLLSLLASRTGGLMNLADVSRSLELPYMTLKRYLALLQALFLVVPVPAYAQNLGKRLVKSSKLYINDSGLLCYLLGRDREALESNRTLLGLVYENFVVMELVKHLGWSQIRPKLFHYRTQDSKAEVDIVLEARNGSVVGIECKVSSTVNNNSFKGLYNLKEALGKKFNRGVVLYTGSNVLHFAEDMIAIPVSALWQTTSQDSPKLYETEPVQE